LNVTFAIHLNWGQGGAKVEVLYLIGRIVVFLFFLFNGINHLTRVQMMSGYAASKGLPAPAFFVVVTGIQMIVGAVMVLLGWYLWIGALVLVLFLVPVAFIMHNFWAVEDQQMKMMEMVQFNKNLAIAGCLLMVAALNYVTGWNPISLQP
jgi:uncharacterized membrane protein YphA (DoxX/SURF4 family)